MNKPQVRLVSAVCHGEASEPASFADGKPWKHDAWTVTLGCDGRTLTTPWKAGTGHRSKGTRKPIAPKAEDVLASLIMDSESGNATFSEFCGNMGMDTDSRKALETYLACQKTGEDLRRLLGVNPAALIYERDAEQVAADLCAVRD